MDYTALSLGEVRAGLDAVARDSRATFAGLDARQLNWQPDASRWSVAQCLEHLITANGLMFRAAEDALQPGQPRSVWQRLPLLPRALGRMLIRSQSPEGARKFKASPLAQPASSAIAPDVVERFIEQSREAVARLGTLDESEAARTIMTSPFVRVIAYSVLDGWRLVLAHDRRHLEQARRVTLARGFPASESAGPAPR